MTPLSFDTPINATVLYTVDSEGTQNDAKKMAKTLRERGHDVTAVRVTSENWRRVVNKANEVVFNLAEDNGWILYPKVGRAIERRGLAQVGIDNKVLDISMDKTAIKKKLSDNGIYTPKYRILKPVDGFRSIRGMEYPLMVKPANQHASEGISQDSVVIDNKELSQRVTYLRDRFGGDILVEEYIDGQEFHATVIGNGRHLVTLPYVGIEYGGSYIDNWNILTYDSKWKKDSWQYWDCKMECPFSFGEKVDEAFDKMLKKAFRVLGCKDIARFDLRRDAKGRANIIDVNMPPSLSGADDDPCWMSAKSLGWTYPEFVETLMVAAYRRTYKSLPDKMRMKEREVFKNL